MIATRRHHEESSNYGMLGRVIVHADLDCFYCQVTDAVDCGELCFDLL